MAKLATAVGAGEEGLPDRTGQPPCHCHVALLFHQHVMSREPLEETVSTFAWLMEN